jgi:hypothetical protein
MDVKITPPSRVTQLITSPTSKTRRVHMIKPWKKTMLYSFLAIVFLTLLAQGAASAGGLTYGREKLKGTSKTTGDFNLQDRDATTITPPVTSAPKDKLCGPNQIGCANVCTDPKTDNKNCGSCGKVCNTGQACVAGVCSNPRGQRPQQN